MKSIVSFPNFSLLCPILFIFRTWRIKHGEVINRKAYSFPLVFSLLWYLFVVSPIFFVNVFSLYIRGGINIEKGSIGVVNTILLPFCVNGFLFSLQIHFTLLCYLIIDEGIIFLCFFQVRRILTSKIKHFVFAVFCFWRVNIGIIKLQTYGG